MNVRWDTDLIQRYDLSGPRYTSYPTAVQFDPLQQPDDLIDRARASADPSAPLSLYVHIPFCAHVCYYCACNKVITRNRGKARAYLDNLYREMAQSAELFGGERLVDQLHWGGGTPTFISNDEMVELMQQLRRHFKLRNDDSGDYSIEVDPREADSETLAVLRHIGFNRLSLGVQDLNPQVQLAVNRVQPLEMTKGLLESARREGFRSINLDLIYGLPYQTPQSFADTLEQVIELSPDRLSVFNYAHLPDRFRSQKHIRAETLPSPDAKLQILHESIDRLLAAGYVYIGMDHFAKPDDSLAVAQRSGQLHRNFQGYTTHADCDLVALGVSAISQIGDVYFQNEHEIESYRHAVETRSSAVRRGLVMRPDDLVRRDVIASLICHFELDETDIEQRHGIRFTDYFAPELCEFAHFEQDSLIRREGRTWYVTDAGRLLIRRICMTFDAYIPKSQPVQGFSKII
ncbi:MAG: oxygen-independent coproporphyrinogen III oxidase [Oceanospirillaceae bacterium]|nr:oxygen-independent coproporphyrinogen III oxidase [Oceanospirillaceae bacterium]